MKYKQKDLENKEDFSQNLIKTAKNVSKKTKNMVVNSKDKIITAIDINGNGQIDIEDIIILGLKTPGIRVDRECFLKRELSRRYSKETIEKAIKTTPLNADILQNDINKIADNVIKYERNYVSGISAALSTPGGLTMVATIPADIIQYYGYMLRVAQKLMYLYGFPEINVDEKNQSFDSETVNLLIVCLGVMYGVSGANNAIKAIAKALSVGVEKKLIHTALTKGTIYPIVKSVSKWFGVKMTKEIFAGFFKKAIPVAGGIIGGGITFITFKSCCDKLKESLQDTDLSNTKHIEIKDENIIIDNI